MMDAYILQIGDWCGYRYWVFEVDVEEHRRGARLSQGDDLGNSVVTLYVYLYTELENVGANWFEFAHYTVVLIILFARSTGS